MNTAFGVGASIPDTSEPDTRLRQAIGEVLAAAYPEPSATIDPGTTVSADSPRARRLRPILEKYFDLDLLTRRAIGPSWRTFTVNQQQQTVKLFTELVFRSYADKFGSGVRPVIAYQPAVILAPNRQELPLTATQDATVTAVAFRFELTGTEWRIYDVVVEGISLVGNYRAQFNAILLKSGASGVLRALEAKIADRPAVSAK